MNDLTLLRDYGPDADPVAPAALAHARSELDAEIRRARSPRVLARRPRTTVRRTGVRLVGVLAAACVALLAIVLVADRTGPRGAKPSSRPGTVLVAFQVPAFPYSLRPMPAGLEPPTFDYDRGADQGGAFMAHYRAIDQQSVLHVIATHESPSRPTSREDVRVVRDTTFDGHPALLTTIRGSNQVALAWEWSPGQWIEVSGDGRFGTEAAVRAMASRVVAGPQRVTPQVHLAPEGWVLDRFKDGTILTLADPHNRDRTLSVNLKNSMAVDFVQQSYGGHDLQRVSVNGKRADLIKVDQGWALQAPIGDRAFELQAPIDLTAEQVVQLAESVSLT